MGADLAGEALRRAALARWAWRSEIKHQVVNTDIDGLLTGALLHHEFDWPIIGSSDTAHSWIDSRVPTPLNLRETTWVDLDMCVPGSRSISQHVVSNTAAEAELVTAFAESVNPNLLVGRHRLDRYTDKYPYGTFQWVAWLVGNDLGTSTGDAIASGLAWMPDGGAFSLSNFRSNCLDWATPRCRDPRWRPLRAVTRPRRSTTSGRRSHTSGASPGCCPAGPGRTSGRCPGAVWADWPRHSHTSRCRRSSMPSLSSTGGSHS